MRCSEFRDLHCAFVDDTVAGVELVRMQRHIAECSECAELDARIRRSLMLVRNLRGIEPSPDFGKRLEQRLQQCREEQQRPMGGSFRTVAVFGAVASAMMLAYMSESLHSSNMRGQDVVLPPVVAMAAMPAHSLSRSARSRRTDTLSVAPAPAIVASVSAGMPFWTAALLTEQTPLQLASYTDGR